MVNLDPEKKRARDRRAQQNLRDKRSAYVRALEEKVASVEKELSAAQQAAFRQQQHLQLQEAQPTASPSPQEAQPIYSVDRQSSESGIQALHRIPDDMPDSTSPTVLRHASNTSALRTTISQSSNPGTHQFHEPSEFQVTIRATNPSSSRELCIPRWHVTPFHAEGDVVVTDVFSLWISSPDLVRSSPETPTPVELLYGSKKNFLANIIHEGVRKWPSGECERLAGGWLAYRLIKWMIEPTRAHFDVLHGFQKPVPEQLCRAHPYFIDFVIWPAFRALLVERQDFYDTVQVMGMLTCTLKVRWPWNQSPLQPDESGQLQMKPDFVATFTSPQGWYITDDFAAKFPALVEGLDATVFQVESSFATSPLAC